MELNTIVFQFLLAIQAVESNNGKQLNHVVFTNVNSIHFGDSAIGRFGLVPNTIRLLGKDPELVKISPKYELEVAKLYAIRVLSKAKGCPLKASILWLRGPAATPRPQDYQSPRYKRFMTQWTYSNGPHKDLVKEFYCK